MSWPYELPRLHNNLYSNSLNTYSNPVYFPSLNENLGINNFSSSFLNFSPQNLIIINQFTPNQSFNFKPVPLLPKFAQENYLYDK